MKFFDKKSEISLSDRFKIISKSKKAEDGRSAKTLVEFCARPCFEETLKNIISPFFKESIELEEGIFEKMFRFDNFGKGRMSDLAVYGKTSKGKRFVIDIEAKVNESFGSSRVYKEYEKGKKKIESGEPTKIVERIDNLINKYYPGLSPQADVYYQLLYSCAGIACDEREIKILMFLSFKTEKANQQKQEANKNEFLKFIKGINASKLLVDSENYYIAKIGEQIVYIVYSEYNMLGD